MGLTGDTKRRIEKDFDSSFLPSPFSLLLPSSFPYLHVILVSTSHLVACTRSTCELITIVGMGNNLLGATNECCHGEKAEPSEKQTRSRRPQQSNQTLKEKQTKKPGTSGKPGRRRSKSGFSSSDDDTYSDDNSLGGEAKRLAGAFVDSVKRTQNDRTNLVRLKKGCTDDNKWGSYVIMRHTRHLLKALAGSILGSVHGCYTEGRCSILLRGE